MSQSLTILGIDPGYDRIGWAAGQWHDQKWQSIDFGCIQTDPHAPIFDRYQQIQRDLRALLSEFQPQLAGIEVVFFGKNQKTALRVSEARGVILAELLQTIPEVQELMPNQIKQAVTGYGTADKTAVAKMVRLGLQLGDEPIIDDAMDALAIMMTCQSLYALTHLRPTTTTR